jgi:hypothetical protein
MGTQRDYNSDLTGVRVDILHVTEPGLNVVYGVALGVAVKSESPVRSSLSCRLGTNFGKRATVQTGGT